MKVTTYWQSLELLQAKLDRDTADFVWVRNYEMVEKNEGIGRYYEYEEKDGYHLAIRKDIHQFCTDIIPAWSLSALWEIVGKVARFYFEETDKPEYIIERLIDLYKEYGEN